MPKIEEREGAKEALAGIIYRGAGSELSILLLLRLAVRDGMRCTWRGGRGTVPILKSRGDLMMC